MKMAFQPTTHKPPKRHFTLLTGAQGPGGSESEGEKYLCERLIGCVSQLKGRGLQLGSSTIENQQSQI
jgi:hypothetical protein